MLGSRSSQIQNVQAPAVVMPVLWPAYVQLSRSRTAESGCDNAVRGELGKSK